ncbi:MAG: tRNA threonylcarbamoyladenosine dehydratase [Clostridia bacterium]|nr:tRNA threonylcarbamoyladenosine dehydratase [Clostridia bacterium]
MEELIRTEMLLGKESLEALKTKRVIVFGIGGVGGYTCEALARSGIGKIDIVDNDTISLSNINRQIIALHSTVGRYKVDVMRERMLDINPNIDVTAYKTFFTPESSSEFNFSNYDYVIDAIDTVAGKIELCVLAKKANVMIISSMGAGNKLDPTAFKVADISKTSVCPLARVVRNELKKRGIKGVKAVYSEETPIIPRGIYEKKGRGYVPGSCAYIPSVAGLIIASEVIKDLTKDINFDKTV